MWSTWVALNRSWKESAVQAIHSLDLQPAAEQLGSLAQGVSADQLDAPTRYRNHQEST